MKRSLAFLLPVFAALGSASAQSTSPTASTVSAGRLENVRLLPSEGPPKAMVVHFSDRAGWTPADDAVAAALRKDGDVVLGVDLSAYAQTLDISRARSELGYAPVVSLDEALAFHFSVLEGGDRCVAIGNRAVHLPAKIRWQRLKIVVVAKPNGQPVELEQMRHGPDQPLQGRDVGTHRLLLGAGPGQLGVCAIGSLAALLVAVARDGVLLHFAVGGIEGVERLIESAVSGSPRREQLVRFIVDGIQSRHQRAQTATRLDDQPPDITVGGQQARAA